MHAAPRGIVASTEGWCHAPSQPSPGPQSAMRGSGMAQGGSGHAQIPAATIPDRRRVINREWPILQNRILQETQGYQTPSRHSSTKLVPDIQPVVLRSLHRVDLVQGIRITFLTSPSCKPETHLDVLQWQGYDVGVVFLFPALHALQLSCAATHTSASSHMDCAPLSRMTMWTSTNTLSHSDDKVEHGHMILIALSGSPAANATFVQALHGVESLLSEASGSESGLFRYL